MITRPKLEDRDAQHYVGIRTRVPMPSLKKVIPKLLGEVFTWLDQQGEAPVGAPLIRYHVINMAGNLDVELGVPVATALTGDDRVSPGIIPAGRYATLVYSGVTGIKGNKALLDWAVKKTSGGIAGMTTTATHFTRVSSTSSPTRPRSRTKRNGKPRLLFGWWTNLLASRLSQRLLHVRPRTL